MYVQFLSAAVVLFGLAHAQSPPSSRQLALGDQCQLKDGRPGVCAKLEECPVAIEELRGGKSPTTCFFERFTAVTCCPTNRRSSQTSTAPPPRASPPSSNRPSSECLEPARDWSLTPEEEQSLKRLAEQKCNEYRQICSMDIQSRIVGGITATPREFPHMAVIGFGEREDNQWLCGGSLISRRHVVTVSQCLQSTAKGCARRVLLGAVSLNESSFDSRPQEFEIVRRIRHPSYMPPQRYHNIAIVELDRDVDITEYVRPACLYTDFDPPKDVEGIATGFGVQNWLDFTGSNVLLKVAIPFQPFEQCNTTYKVSYRLPNGIDNKGMLCAGDLNGNKDTCKGDSGGPLQVKDPNDCIYKIIGLTAFGSAACGAPNSPAVYTRVSTYVPWIAKTIWT